MKAHWGRSGTREFTDDCISFPRRQVRRQWQSWLPLVDHSIHGDGLLSLGCSWFFERRNRQEDDYPNGCDRGGLTAAPEAPPRFEEPPGGIASQPESGLRPAPTTAVAPSVPALQSQPEKEPPKLAKVVVPAVERAGRWPSKTVLVPSLFAVGSLLVAGGNAVAGQTGFRCCKSTYALCTSAVCTPVPGKEGTVSCACDVKTGWSAGRE
jgi:hypothetical protein